MDKNKWIEEKVKELWNKHDSDPEWVGLNDIELMKLNESFLRSTLSEGWDKAQDELEKEFSVIDKLDL